MVSFEEMMKSYGVQNDAKSLFSEMLANASVGGVQGPLDRDKALLSIKAGDEWHNNMIRLVASFVREGLSLEETIAKLDGVTLTGYTEQQTIAEITTAYMGAVAKGYGKTTRTAMPTHFEAPSPKVVQPLLQWLHEIPDTEPEFLVDGLVERNSLCLIFGKPASGKSFFAVDLAASVATGQSFHGIATQRGDVVYIAGEGSRGLKRRFRAWAKNNETAESEIRVMVSRSPVNYRDEQAAKELETELRSAQREGLEPVLFIIDTLARNYGGGDENSNSDMGRFITVLDQFNARFNCATLIVHHSGHAESNRGRGASALKGALDAEFMCIKDRENIVVSCTKMKDAEEPEDVSLSLKTVEFGFSSEGKAISSAILVRNEDAVIRQKFTSANARDLRTFHEAAAEHNGVMKIGDVIVEKRVSLENWREIYNRRATQDNPDAKRKAFERARKSLVERGFLEVRDDIYTLKLHGAGQTGHEPDN